jgi:hypothetical protein
MGIRTGLLDCTSKLGFVATKLPGANLGWPKPKICEGWFAKLDHLWLDEMRYKFIVPWEAASEIADRL